MAVELPVELRDCLAMLLTGAHAIAEIDLEHDRSHGPMSQDEQGGCVWCGQDGYNGVEKHNSECAWTQGHAILAKSVGG
jgi:hypothetical protein